MIAATKKGGDEAVRGPVLVVQVEVLCRGSPALGHPSPPEWVVADTPDGVAACVAWFLAVLLLGLDAPTFAPIAAVISLGLAIGERGRRAVELTLGVGFGVLLADFFGVRH